MTNKQSLLKNILLFSVFELSVFWLIVFAVFMFLISGCKDEKPLRVLPVYGPVDEQTKANHTIAPFSLTDQNNMVFTSEMLDGKIYVADFFFTTCKSICPKMSTNMQSVYEKFKDNNQIAFVSYTVNPANDTAEVLKEYASKHGVTTNNWIFLTGDKKQIYDLARKSYLVDASEGNGDDEDFVHTQNFALVDKKKRIRGYYDGTNPQDVQKLIAEINILLQEAN